MTNCTTTETDKQVHDPCADEESTQQKFRMPDPPPEQTVNDGTASQDGNDDKVNQPNQKELILAAAEAAEYWHDPDREAYATIKEDGHLINCKVRSKLFQQWLGWKVYSDYGIAPASQPMADVLRILEAKARYEGEQFDTYIRIAGDEHTTYLHLGDETGTVFRINTEGVVDAPDANIKFLTKQGMKALSKPIVPSSIEDARLVVLRLRQYCNLQDESDWKLFLVALLSALRPLGPFVVVLIVGEQGAAKSTLCKVLRRLVDPSLAPLRSAPREERDLWIAANNGWLIVFDNISSLSKGLSDALCRLASGGGNSYRTLYENDSETLFQAQRLILLNTIDDLALRGDIIDRAIRLTCLKIDDSKRKTEEEFWSAFDEQEAEILGALLMVLSETLKHLPDIKLTSSPRMADFAKFGVAVETTMGWEEGSFLKAYEENRAGMAALALEDQLANLICGLDDFPIEKQPTGLWEQLRIRENLEADRLPKWFPSNAQALSSRLRRLAPFLRRRAIEIEFGKKGGKRIIRINKAEGADASDPSSASKEQQDAVV